MNHSSPYRLLAATPLIALLAACGGEAGGDQEETSATDTPPEIAERQENFEGIHQHNAFAERFGTLSEMRREIVRGEHVLRHTSLAEWLKE